MSYRWIAASSAAASCRFCSDQPIAASALDGTASVSNSKKTARNSITCANQLVGLGDIPRIGPGNTEDAASWPNLGQSKPVSGTKALARLPSPLADLAPNLTMA
jgi:hypothetical protein